MNFFTMLNDVLLEQNKTFKDLEFAGIICERTFYQYKIYTPYLPQIIKIANYLEISLDYLAHLSDKNNFKQYKNKPINFYSKLCSNMQQKNISQAKLAKDICIGRSNFSYWKNGKLPKFETLIMLAKYLECYIDDFMDFE